MKNFKAAALIAISLTVTPAFADDEAVDLTEVEQSRDQMSSGIEAFASATTLSEQELGEQRAAAKLELDSITINDSNQDGLVTNNNADGNTTGGNYVNSGAFENSSGFLSTIQNTGNNVLIQNATIINVSVEQ